MTYFRGKDFRAQRIDVGWPAKMCSLSKLGKMNRRLCFTSIASPPPFPTPPLKYRQYSWYILTHFFACNLFKVIVFLFEWYLPTSIRLIFLVRQFIHLSLTLSRPLSRQTLQWPPHQRLPNNPWQGIFHWYYSLCTATPSERRLGGGGTVNMLGYYSADTQTETIGRLSNGNIFWKQMEQ